MTFVKGKVKTGGKVAGVPNKITRDLRLCFSQLLESKVDQMSEWFDRVAISDPDKALTLMLQLAEYHMPKLSRTEINSNITINKPIIIDWTGSSADNTDGQTAVGLPIVREEE